MTSVQVDVIMPLPEGWGFCMSCETLMAEANLGSAPYERGLDEYTPEWQEDFRQISAVVFNLADRYGDGIIIRIFDPRSLQGLWKSLRYGVHRYPTFIINGCQKIIGWDAPSLELALKDAGASALLEVGE